MGVALSEEGNILFLGYFCFIIYIFVQSLSELGLV